MKSEIRTYKVIGHLAVFELISFLYGDLNQKGFDRLVASKTFDWWCRCSRTTWPNLIRYFNKCQSLPGLKWNYLQSRICAIRLNSKPPNILSYFKANFLSNFHLLTGTKKSMTEPLAEAMTERLLYVGKLLKNTTSKRHL